MHEESAGTAHQESVLRRLRARVVASRSYSDDALLALVLVARERHRRKIWPFVQRCVYVVGWMILGLAVGVILAGAVGVLLFFFQIEGVAGLLAVLVLSAIAGGLLGLRIGRDAVFIEQMSRLLREPNCFACGSSLPHEMASPDSQHVCSECGTVRTPPPPKGPANSPVQVAVNEETKSAYPKIAELHVLDIAEASAIVAATKSFTAFRLNYCMQWVAALAVIGGVLVALLVFLGGSLTAMGPQNYFGAIGSIALGAVLLGLVKQSLGTTLHRHVQAALSPRTHCLKCGYSLSGLQVDSTGYSRCSECGLRARPFAVTPSAPRRSRASL